MSKRLPRGQTGHVSADSSTVSDHHDDLSADDLPGTFTLERQVDGSLEKKVRGPRRRRRFHPKRRKEVAIVRERGACTVCRAKKIACKHALQEQDLPPVPNPPMEELLIGTGWPAANDAQQPVDLYNPVLNIHTSIPIPQNRLEGLGYVEHLYTIANSGLDGHVDTSMAASWVNDPDTSRAIPNPSPILMPQNFYAPTDANSISTYDLDGGLHRSYEGGFDSTHQYAYGHDLQRLGSSSHDALQQSQLLSRSPVDEHHPDYLLQQDPNLMEWQRAGTEQGAVAFSTADQAGVERETRLDKLAQVQLLIDESYHPGMEDTSVGHLYLADLREDDVAQIASRLSKLGTSSRAGVSVSGRSTARVQKGPVRRSTNPPRQGDSSYGPGRGWQTSQLRRLSIPGSMYASTHRIDPVTPVQQPQMSPHQPFLGGVQSDAESYFRQTLSPQGYQQRRDGLIQSSVADLGQGPSGMYITEHAVPNAMLDWTRPSFLSSSPTGPPFSTAYGGDGYLPVNDPLQFAQAHSGMMTSPHSLPYANRSMISDSDFGGDTGYCSVTGNHQSQLSHANPTVHVPLTSTGHHSRHPSIALNGEVVCIPEPSFDTYSIPRPELSSSNAFSDPVLVFSGSGSGSVSSVGNESYFQPSQQKNSTSAIKIGGMSSYAGGNHGPQYSDRPNMNEKFMPTPDTIAVQEGEGDEASFMDWSLFEVG